MKICGIYKITSPSGKIYIGQSVDIDARWKQYRRIDCKKQSRLYNSFKKYGIEKHKFEIIHICEPNELNELEKYYMNLYNTFNTEYGLNLAMCGVNGVMFNRHHSEETKKKLRKPLSKEHVLKLKKAWETRKPASTETNKKISETLKRKYKEGLIKNGMKGKISPNNGVPQSKNAKEKFKEKMKGRPWTENRRNAYLKKKGITI